MQEGDLKAVFAPSPCSPLTKHWEGATTNQPEGIKPLGDAAARGRGGQKGRVGECWGA